MREEPAPDLLPREGTHSIEKMDGTKKGATAVCGTLLITTRNETASPVGADLLVREGTSF